jgi:uncharacterized metal-binding protein YceD (DUF177 family)
VIFVKWALAQLNKIQMPYTFDECLDLSELNGFENIKTISNVNVRTTIKEYGDDTYQCEFIIKADIELEDSVSLEVINFTVDTKAVELYSTNEEMDATIIDTNTLDTKEAIIQAILSEKPVSVSSHDYVEDIEEEDDEENINSAFASLKDLL